MKRKIGIIIFLIIILFGFTLGYATNEVGYGYKKNVYYDNVRYEGDVVINNVDGMNIDFEGNLSAPGDYYEIYIDVINASNMDVEVTDLSFGNTTDYLGYSLTYINGSNINVGDILKRGQIKTLKYRVDYKKYILTDTTIDSTFNINYEGIY